MTAPIRLLIADDHPLLATGLRQVIATDPRLEVVAEAARWCGRARIADGPIGRMLRCWISRCRS